MCSLDILLQQGVLIKTWVLAAIIAAMLCLVASTHRVAIAGTVDERGDPVDLRNGLAGDMPVLSSDEIDDRVESPEIVPGLSRTFGLDRSRDTADGIAVPIQGVFFTFDAVVAKSFSMDLATNAGAEDDDLPLNGTGRNPASSTRRVMKVSANFNEHVKSVAESKFQSPNSSYINDWDLRDFRPPEWVMKLREMARERVPGQPPPSRTGYADGSGYSYGTGYSSGTGYSHGTGYAEGTGESESADPTSWLMLSANIFLIIQRRIEEMDSMTMVLIALLILPLLLLAVAWKTREYIVPSQGTHRRSRRTGGTSRPPTRVRVRTRRSRKRADSMRVKTGLQN